MTKNLILFLITFSIGTGLLLFLNGNLSIKSNPLPPLGKFLNPWHGVWQNAERKLPEELAGASTDSVSSVLIDERLVAHIFANNINDALYLQGYMEARDRLFQMEMIARGASGRVAEVLGERGLELDRAALRKGMCLAGDRAVENWARQEKVMVRLNSYLKGVNDYIAQLKPKDYPIEYKLLDFEPSSFKVRDIASIYLYMCDVLSGKTTDILQTNALNALGGELYNELFSKDFTGDIPVITTPVKVISKLSQTNADSSVVLVSPINMKELYSSPDGIGSNNWAVTKSKSATGKPILASDPHLRLNLPSIWYELQISATDFSAYGVSFPGIPGILIGFNEDVAWAETNGSIDVADLIKIQWKDGQREEYLYDGKYMEVEKLVTEIKIKGTKSIFDTTHLTMYGPIKYYSKDLKNDLAVQWVALDGTTPFDVTVFADIMQSKNIQDLDAKLRVYSSPAQNILTADNLGNIGLRVMGNIPARGVNDGVFVEEGSGSKNLWNRYIPFEDMPHQTNPASDFLSSANQKSIDATYPYFLGGNFETYRNLRINRLLNEGYKFSSKDFKAFQRDNHSVKAENVVPLILKYSEGKYNAYDELLENWDFTYDADEKAAVIFDKIYENIRTLTYDELTNNATYETAMPNKRRLEMLMSQPKHPIFDLKSTEFVEDLGDIVNLAIKEVLDEEAGKPMKTYGASRSVDIPHILRIPSFSVNNLSLGGNEDCLNAQRPDWGPSWRMIVELGDQPQAWGVYPGGQSGNPASKHYKDFISTWSQKDYFKINFLHSAEDMMNEESKLYRVTP
ncbi:MAG: penicillin acylase family protein [Saprospiraceae bacterium]|nr:penicillin acylase family protein [Saprospiraceae bacterium]